jgi:hypothetical protein
MGSIAVQDLFTQDQYQNHQLGALYIDERGNKYRYVQNGGVALTTGNLLQEAAEDTNYRSMAVAANAAIGATAVTVTLGGTAVTANQFDEGHLFVESSTGIGQQFRIIRHDVQTSTTGSCTFTLDRPLLIALTTSSQVTVRKSAYDGVVAFPVTPTGGAVGVALYAMTIGYFGWIQSGGDCPVLFDNQEESAADANALKPSEDVAGSVAPKQEADVATPHIGWSREMVSVDSTMCMAHLTID